MSYTLENSTWECSRKLCNSEGKKMEFQSGVIFKVVAPAAIAANLP